MGAPHRCDERGESANRRRATPRTQDVLPESCYAPLRDCRLWKRIVEGCPFTPVVAQIQPWVQGSPRAGRPGDNGTARGQAVLRKAARPARVVFSASRKQETRDVEDRPGSRLLRLPTLCGKAIPGRHLGIRRATAMLESTESASFTAAPRLLGEDD